MQGTRGYSDPRKPVIYLNEMTSGSPLKILVRFSLPMLLSMIFQQLYNIIDSIIAGNYLGINGLAATGVSYPITSLFIAVATGASVGCAVVISQLFGAKLMARVKTAIYTAAISLTVLSLVLTVVGLLTCDWLLTVIHTSSDIFADAAAYLQIYMFGLLFLFLYNAANSIYSGLGNSVTPLYFLIFSSVLNVVLDLVFVTCFDLGVSGLAWATLIAQGLSAILATLSLILRVRRIRLPLSVPLWNLHTFLTMLRVALPSICQQSFVSVGLFLVQGVVNDCGKLTAAAFSASLKVSTFALMVMNTLPNALSSFASQNIGARRLDRVSQGLRISIVIAEAVILLINVGFIVFGRQILGLFVTDAQSTEIIDIGVRFLYTVAPFYLLIGVKNCCDSILRGGGAMGTFMLTTFSDLIVRVAFSYLFAAQLGFAAICWAYPVGWVVGTALSIVFYRLGGWKPAAVKADGALSPHALQNAASHS